MASVFDPGSVVARQMSQHAVANRIGQSEGTPELREMAQIRGLWIALPLRLALFVEAEVVVPRMRRRASVLGVLLTATDTGPAYPLEHGIESLLASLASLPLGTSFERIDDIDRCMLFWAPEHASNTKSATNPFDERNLHAAVWHDDLSTASPMSVSVSECHPRLSTADGA